MQAFVILVLTILSRYIC